MKIYFKVTVELSNKPYYVVAYRPNLILSLDKTKAEIFDLNLDVLYNIVEFIAKSINYRTNQRVLVYGYDANTNEIKDFASRTQNIFNIEDFYKII